MLIGMNAEDMKGMTPCERFCKYFEVAKEVYCQSHECNKVNQKMMVAWYNGRFEATLTDVSLSKQFLRPFKVSFNKPSNVENV